MPIYKYKAVNGNGIGKNGAIWAEDYRHAYNALYARRYYPTEIKKMYFVPRKVSPDDLLVFFMHLHFQLKCGVSLNEAIESFSDLRENRILDATVADISDSLNKGEGIGNAFEKCRSVFGDVIAGLMKSAENTGNAGDIISNVLNFLKLQINWKNKVKRAIAYPIFIAAIALTILISGIGVLGPQIAALIRDCGDGKMPLLTDFAINALPEIAKIIIVFLSAASASLPILLRVRKGKDLLAKIILKIPKIKEFVIKISLWQFCKVLHIAMEAKLDFMSAFDLALETVKITPIRDELADIRDDITEGYKIFESFSSKEFIPVEILAAVRIGEEGNDLGGSFGHLSESQYDEIMFEIRSFGRILSAGLTIFTGFVFIFILCSLFYPIYSYVETVGA
ncbi:MAG: type II secretion system F family protein [Holosporaceae bacterium]|jgi:type II secretory pathway component PulF|nr:type II secretion system F family protein [Holosporaceae bacterium]